MMNIKYYKTIRKHPGGFSAIEIIAVIFIVAVIGVIAVSRFTSTTPYRVASETEILKAHLHYAQFRALSAADTTYGVNNTTWGISLSANSYTLQKDRVNATTNLPGENSPTHNFPDGVSITTGAGTAITYNVWGTPVDAAGIPLTGNATINISDGTSSRTITVTQNTGFIP